MTGYTFRHLFNSKHEPNVNTLEQTHLHLWWVVTWGIQWVFKDRQN